ncbi:MAG: hypothetical protein M1819_003419 [Sarea resinae]|nr:MAG: hypothetical protein M1819_003419 [Sarea resinae]
MAVLNSGSSAWQWPRDPVSPNSPESTSREATPVPQNRNPWSNASSSPNPSPPTTPSKTPPASPHTSSKVTPLSPVHPRPIHPPFAVPRTPFMPIVPPSPAPSEWSTSSPTPIPNPALQRSQGIASPSVLCNSILTPTLISDLKLTFPRLLAIQGWDRPTAEICYIWALRNPRVALLLYMTDNLVSWPVASIFSPLDDSMLPFSEADLAGVVSDIQNVLDHQWRAMVRALPQNGEHVEITAKEALPLKRMEKASEDLDKVRWLGSHQERTYARKVITCAQPGQKATVLGHVQRFKRLNHDNIVKIICTYAQGNTIGVIYTPLTECNLEEYLQLPIPSTKRDLLRSWLVDLVSAMEHIHAADIRHQDIRPGKILVDGDHICFAGFGLLKDSTNGDQPTTATRIPGQKSYIYAAPEALTRNRLHRPADIFSLGCVFVEMMTVARGRTVESFRSFRTTNNDSSFHSHLDRVSAWIQRLESGQQRHSHDADLAVDAMALSFISPMLAVNPSARPKARQLATSISGWNTWRMAQKQGGDGDGFLGGRWGEPAGSEGYYSRY